MTIQDILNMLLAHIANKNNELDLAKARGDAAHALTVESYLNKCYDSLYKIQALLQ